MLIFLFLVCCCQSSFVLQFNDAPVIQALGERITLLELNQGQQKMGASHSNDPLSNIPGRNDVISENTETSKVKSVPLRKNCLTTKKQSSNWKIQRTKSILWKKIVDDLSITVIQQRKEIKRTQGLETKFVDQSRRISDLRKRTFNYERIIFNFQNQLDMFLNSDKSIKKIFDSLDKSHGENENQEDEKYNSIRNVHREIREFHSQQSKFI